MNKNKKNTSNKKDQSKNTGNRGGYNKGKKAQEAQKSAPTMSRDQRAMQVQDDPKMYVNRVMGSSNDFSWYDKNPGLIGDAAKISWFNQLGAKVGTYGTSTSPDYVVPGIMVFDTITGPGLSTASTSGASMAGLGLYDAIRRNLNKPNPEYETQDSNMYILAADDLFAQFTDMLRAFGIVHTWSGDNLYTPKAYMKAIYGWTTSDFDSFVSNEANYRATFNQLVYKASSFLFYPANFSITDRHAWLFGNLFVDHDSNKAQVYAFRKENTWLFNETLSQKGTALEYIRNPEKRTMDIMLSQFDQCIEALRNSTLVRSLIADMRQAFGDKNILQMSRIDETYSITPTYDPIALMQIENMDVNFGFKSIYEGYAETLNVTQDVNKNILIWEPFLEAESDTAFELIAAQDKVINIHTEDTSEKMVTEATRLMVPILPTVYYPNPTSPITGWTFGIAADMVIDAKYMNDPTGESDIKQMRTLVRSTASLATLQDWVQNDLATWMAFDWAPKLWYSYTPTSGEAKVLPLLEWDHYTVIGSGDYSSVLQRLNVACNLSMWSIPEWNVFSV